jgi:hypothetical protein
MDIEQAGTMWNKLSSLRYIFYSHVPNQARLANTVFVGAHPVTVDTHVGCRRDTPHAVAIVRFRSTLWRHPAVYCGGSVA